MSLTFGFKDFLLENAKQPLCNFNMWVIIGHRHQLQNMRPTKISLGYISTYLHGVQPHPKKQALLYLSIFGRIFCQEVPFMACMRGNYFAKRYLSWLAWEDTISPPCGPMYRQSNPSHSLAQKNWYSNLTYIHASYKWWTEVQQKNVT